MSRHSGAWYAPHQDNPTSVNKFWRADGTWGSPVGDGIGAPDDATYITTSANGTLTAEKVLGTEIVIRASSAPSVGPDGAIWVDTTPGSVYVSNGSSWVERWSTKGAADAAYVSKTGDDTTTGVKTLSPADTKGTALSFNRRSGWVGDGGPPRMIEFLDAVTQPTLPYKLAAYFTEQGQYNSSVGVTVSEKRDNANGNIQGLAANAAGEEPPMIEISPDIPGPAVGAEGHAGLGTGFEGQYAFAAYDLDDTSGGASAYTIGYGKKKFGITGDGSLHWGANLGYGHNWDIQLKRSAEKTLSLSGALSIIANKDLAGLTIQCANTAANYTDAVMTQGSGVCTSATATFVSGDVGKWVTVAGAGEAGSLLYGVVASRQSGTQVTLDRWARTTVSAAALSVGRSAANTDVFSVKNTSGTVIASIGTIGHIVTKGAAFLAQNSSGTTGAQLSYDSGLQYGITGLQATGAGAATLGTNCPAVTAAAPQTWFKVTMADGSQGYIPVWK